MAAPPSPTVEVAFGDNWDETSQTWVDVTQYLQSASWDRKFSWETGLYTGGRCTVVLVDADRLFDPLHITGTYVDQIVPGVQVRVSATHGASDYTMWRGFLDRAVRSYTPHGRGATTLTCVDGWARLAAADTQSTLDGGVVDTAIVDSSVVGGTVGVDGSAAPTSYRVSSLLGAAGWPSAWSVVATGRVDMPAETSEISSVTTAIGAAVSAELGATYIDREGSFRFDARDTLMSARIATTAQMVLSNVAADSSVVRYLPPSVEIDYVDIVNIATVDPIGELPVTVWNTASMERYGRREVRHSDARVIGTVQAEVNARMIVDALSDPVTRVAPLTFDVLNDTSVEHLHACERELRDRVQWKFTPPGGGATIDKDFHIVGIAQQWQADAGGAPSWTVTVELADAALVDRLNPSLWAVVGTAVVDTDAVYY